MKHHLIRFSAIAAAVILGSITAQADRVPLTQVPDPVQKAIKDHAKGETVRDVERETKDGKTIYQVEFKREGLNRRLEFNEDGTLRPSDRGVADLTTSAPVDLSRLPAAVQKTIQEQKAGRMVADVDMETWNGQQVYEVEFKERGPNSRIHVAQDGSLVMDKRATGRSMFLGTQLSETPKAVQDTAKRVAGTAEIADVDKETWQGRTAYEVEIKQEGMNREVLIAEDGSILRDSEALGNAPGLRERVRGTDTDTDRDVLGRKTVSLNQTPTAVQDAIKAQGAVGALKPIRQEIKDGVTYYHVEFEKDGINRRLKLADDGRVIEDNRR